MFNGPSTPNSRSIRHPPSTTPKEPPPSYMTNKSFTPQGNPRTHFNSSYNPSNNTFGGKVNNFEVPGDRYSDEDAEGEDDHDAEDDIEMPSLPLQSSFKSSILQPSPRGLKRSRDGRPRTKSDMEDIARGMARKANLAVSSEPDQVLVGTEHILSELDTAAQRLPARTGSTLTDAAAKLTKLWRDGASVATKEGDIGPKANSGFAKANYIASLLLRLHHPHTDQPGRSLVRNHLPDIRPSHAVPMPRALLEWLDIYHKPFPDDYDVIRLNQPAPSAEEVFWDVIFSSLMRGKLDRVIDLLRNAGWEHAISATTDYEDEDVEGYDDFHVETASEAARRCATAIEACPGLRQNNWDVKGNEWRAYRHQVQSAMNDLNAFAGDDGSKLVSVRGNMFAGDIVRKSTKANTKVPWTVFENLKAIYNVLLGSTDEILIAAQDWLEGAMYLTIWWDGIDEDVLSESLKRSSLRRSNGQKPRSVDVNPLESYRGRLADAFELVTAGAEESALTVNTMEPVQVALANILEGNDRATIDLLRCWSLSIAVSVVEMGAMGGWLSLTRREGNDELMQRGFTRDDLLVLSAGPTGQGGEDVVDRDAFLREYASQLAKKPNAARKEGWELAVAVLNRLDHPTDAQHHISELLNSIDLEDEARVDKVLSVCDELGLVEQRRSIAERFADALGERQESYGAALIYYARAQATAKLRDTIELLVGLCLAHSVAMPVGKLLDPKLESLLSKERGALEELAKTDANAAKLLAKNMSGYATLRRFYDLRDQDVAAAPVPVMGRELKSLERRRHAAVALFAVLRSASDCITGGLYDAEVESVVSPEGILALLGETLPLLGQERRIFTQQQVFALLAIVEDFAASPSRIRENAESLLQASVAAYKESTSTATGPFKRAASHMSESSWEMLASKSWALQSQTLGKAGKVERAWDWRAGLVGAEEAAATDRHGSSHSHTVLLLIREALIREVARGWGGQLNW